MLNFTKCILVSSVTESKFLQSYFLKLFLIYSKTSVASLIDKVA